MKLYNSLTQKVESFVPRGDIVSIYVCGITPYDTTHLGHIFTYATFDVLIRYLVYQGYQVRYVQNVTDIDDDILRKAAEAGEDWKELGDRWTAHFIHDLHELNVRAPNFFPRATDVIDEIVNVVQRLLEAGVAYESGGNVYFHVDAWPEFGQLSKLPKEEMLPIANERGNRPDDPHKRDPLDFVLWQAQAPGEPAWDSPWSPPPGRPGWHIECSTMVAEMLGNTIDIHGGGADLIFPHHESEIAQAECATGVRPFARFWMHTAMVHHQGEKMSKSLGNLVMVRDLLREWSPDALRLYLAAHHYRDSWQHDEAELTQAEGLAGKLKQAIEVNRGKSEDSSHNGLSIVPAEQAFVRAMNDDLNTGAALRVLEDFAAEIVDAAEAGRPVNQAQASLRQMGRIFGLRLDAPNPEAGVSAGWSQHLRRFERE